MTISRKITTRLFPLTSDFAAVKAVKFDGAAGDFNVNYQVQRQASTSSSAASTKKKARIFLARKQSLNQVINQIP